MVSDLNKSLDSIVYNALNLPQQINISTDGNNEINYLYTANGQKLMKQTRTDFAVERTIDYVGNFVYEDGTLTYLLTGEGRVLVNSGGTYEYQYSLKDHLGNTRITFSQNGEIIQEDAYYPFGMKMNGLCYETGTDYKNKFLYNDKELQDDFGLDWYDYGARFYDPQLGRWHSADPLAEKYRRWSPYNFCVDNPMRFIDPDGMGVDYYQSENGNVVWRDGSAQQIVVNGEKMTNIGPSISTETGDGTYVNHYQNVPISISGEPINAEATIVNNPGLEGQLLSNDSPLSKDSKVGLIQASIHDGQNDFIRGIAELSSEILNTTGDGATYIGTATMAIPGAQGVGGTLIATGSVLSGVGTTIDMGLNAVDGEWGHLTNNAFSLVVTSKVSKGIGTLKATSGELDFLKGALESSVSIVKGITNWGLEKRKEEVKK